MKLITAIIFSLFSFYANAQTFTGVGGGIQNQGQSTYFNLTVSGLNPAQIDSTFGIEQISININHPAVEELWIYLQSPSGNIVELTEGSSCSGVNYTNTNFNNQFSTSITLGTAPYTGNFRPTGYLGRFNTGQTGNGTWQLIVHDGVAFIDSGNVVSWSIQFGNSPSHPVIFTSSNLPIVILNTNNQTISDTDILINMGVIDNGVNRNHTTDPLNSYNAKATIHIRGSSSANFEKKPYSITTIDAAGIQFDTPLLGMPIEHDWDLIASYQDKTLMRDPITYDVSRRMGNYAARFKNVEVILNNEYQGVYAVVEKLKQNQNRINVSKLTSTDNSFPNITGGYIFEIDRPDVPGWSSLLPGESTNNHFYYQYVYPKDSNITVPQQAYIKSFVDTFETVMASPNYADPVNGYPKYIDVASVVDFFIMNELSKNVDAYRLSTYMYKDNISQGGKLHIGPVWDYDLAWHNCNYGDSFDPNFWQYPTGDSVYATPTWWTRFMQDTNFVNKLYCRWNLLRQNILSVNYLNNYIDSSANAMNESQQRNFIQWPILGAYIYPNPQNQTGATYQSEVADIKNWIASRVSWMDGNITGHCAALGIQENSFDNNIVVYPNPFSDFTSLKISGTNKLEMENASLKIYDFTGREKETNIVRNSDGFKISRGNMTSGIYFYRVCSETKTFVSGSLIVTDN